MAFVMVDLIRLARPVLEIVLDSRNYSRRPINLLGMEAFNFADVYHGLHHGGGSQDE